MLNLGYVFLVEMMDEEKLNKVVERLVLEFMFLGYGICIMVEGEVGYNLMSYYDGSIWLYDNSLIVFGLSKVNK